MSAPATAAQRAGRSLLHTSLCADSHPCLLVLLRTAVADGPITLHYNKYVDGSKIGTPASLEVDMVIGADGANSRVAKEIDAGEYDYAIAFQERIKIPGEQAGSLSVEGSPVVGALVV